MGLDAVHTQQQTSHANCWQRSFIRVMLHVTVLAQPPTTASWPSPMQLTQPLAWNLASTPTHCWQCSAYAFHTLHALCNWHDHTLTLIPTPPAGHIPSGPHHLAPELCHHIRSGLPPAEARVPVATGLGVQQLHAARLAHKHAACSVSHKGQQRLPSSSRGAQPALHTLSNASQLRCCCRCCCCWCG